MRFSLNKNLLTSNGPARRRQSPESGTELAGGRGAGLGGGMSLELLFEDEWLLAFNKPAGVPTAPEKKGRREDETLLGWARAVHGEGVTATHRLEPELSGVVLLAKNKAAQDFLSGEFQSRMAESVYQGLVVAGASPETGPGRGLGRGADGALAECFEVDLGLEEDAQEPERMRVARRRGGKPVVTETRVLERFSAGRGRVGFAWLEGRPRTARRHQVRAHWAAIGTPVLNDGLYGDASVQLLLSDLKRGYKGAGDERPLIRRLALHVAAVTFRHPETRVSMTVEAPLAADLALGLKNLRKHAG